VTDDQIAALKAAALAANEHGSFAWHALRQSEFRAAASPDVILALLAERDALRAALREYGWHAATCPQYPTYTEPARYSPCDCGYDAAIAGEEK
jgi:hypothetical protein